MQLAELMIDEMDDDAREQGFIVDTDEKANWVVRKLSAVRQEHRRHTNNIEAEIERLEALKAKADRWLEREEENFTGMLVPYMQAVRDAAKATKTQTTYQLPSGRLKIKHATVKIEKNDELLAFLKETGRDEFIRVKEEPAWSDLKSTLMIVGGQATTDDGEIFERGVNVVETPEVFIIETDII